MAKQPNILLIVADELRADALSAYGNPVCRTPNLDRMAAAGVRFADCVVTQPTCTPSRASILTGAFPSVLKTRMVGCHTPDDPRFLGHGLQRAGYRCASIGKIHLVPQRAEPDLLRAAMDDEASDGYYGFAEVDLVNGHGDGCFGPDYEAHAAARGVDLDHARAQARVGRHQLSPVLGPHRFRLPAELHSSHYLADHTIDLLDSVRNDGRPLFAHVSFPDPHHPFTAPEPWASMYDPAAVPEPVPHGGRHMPSWYDSIYPRGSAGRRRVGGTAEGAGHRPHHRYPAAGLLTGERGDLASGARLLLRHDLLPRPPRRAHPRPSRGHRHGRLHRRGVRRRPRRVPRRPRLRRQGHALRLRPAGAPAGAGPGHPGGADHRAARLHARHRRHPVGPRRRAGTGGGAGHLVRTGTARRRTLPAHRRPDRERRRHDARAHAHAHHRRAGA